jgi:hypothetical protein
MAERTFMRPVVFSHSPIGCTFPLMEHIQFHQSRLVSLEYIEYPQRCYVSNDVMSPMMLYLQ